MLVRYILTVELRYKDATKGEHDSEHRDKTTTIGIFETFDDAMNEGNKALKILAKSFQVRADDKFCKNFLWGMPKDLVTNTFYHTKGIQYFAKIKTLKFMDLQECINEAFEARDRYDKQQEAREND